MFEKFQVVEKVILYGSRAKGDFREGSDIDITVVGKSVNLKVLNKIETAIDKLMLPYTFYISINHQISNPSLVEHIN